MMPSFPSHGSRDPLYRGGSGFVLASHAAEEVKLVHYIGRSLYFLAYLSHTPYANHSKVLP